MNQPWELPGMLPVSEPRRVAKHRRLQSWFREVQLGADAGSYASYAKLGSWLDPKQVAAQRDLNFLHPGAHEHAERRALEVQAEGGSLEPKRLFHNLLSSMPMCFNLFGAMCDEPGFLPVFQQLFDPEATKVTRIVCEWAPLEEAERLGDRTAFDAVVFYETMAGPRFFGIETKYTESFSPTEYQPSTSNRYAEVTTSSGWFARPDAALEELPRRESNQLWRNCMLAAQLERRGTAGEGAVAVVAMRDDKGAASAVERVHRTLAESDRPRLRSIPIQDILAATDKVSSELSWWTTSFRRRYVETDLPDDPLARRDPLGPVLGRSLEATAAQARADS